MEHVPVLLHESIEGLALTPGAVVLDATLGGGGHAVAIAKKIGKTGTLIGLDLDGQAIRRTEEKIIGRVKFILRKANFRHLENILSEIGLKEIDAALFDLGVSSCEIGPSGRGFSFLIDEPLIMTFDDKPDENTITAEHVINLWSQETLTTIFRGFGGEKNAWRIAKAIVAEREKKSIKTTFDLVRVIETVSPRRGKIHPATKIFQAIRMAVNDEVGALNDGLRAVWQALRLGGRLAVISFHEGEDRLVKRIFIDWIATGKGIRITKKPTTPSKKEVSENPRARSAKLRIIEKTNCK